MPRPGRLDLEVARTLLGDTACVLTDEQVLSLLGTLRALAEIALDSI